MKNNPNEDSPYVLFDPPKRAKKYMRGKKHHLLINCSLPRLPRKNEADLTVAEKNAFNAAIATLRADGRYQTIANIHVTTPAAFMHGHHDPDGAVRFLPWHRVYLYELEKLIATVDPNVKIPYWNWRENPTIPAWVNQGDANRNVGAVDMPNGNDVCDLYNCDNYMEFSRTLESFHNTVHVHVGGHMNSSASPTDPIFWLHHAFVDKLWHDWQQLYPGDFAAPTGTSTLNPWPVEIGEAQPIRDFCTDYMSFENCFHAIDDDNSRDIINRRTCEEINNFSNRHLIDIINNMLEGFTGDSDERAILRILNCIDCGRLALIVEAIGVDTLRSNFHGSEDRQLSVILAMCGIIPVSEWDDDTSRDFINTSTCDRINNLSDVQLKDLIENMMSGFTGNEDEQAILRVLNCIGCSRTRNIVNLIGLQNLVDEFHGDEEDQLNLLLARCGIISFASWDDDVTRIFVNSSTCAELTSLPDNQLADLINNMLDGATLDEDEQAILRVLGCLSCERFRSVVNLVGQQRLLDDLHGSEDTDLRVMLGRCGLISFASWDDDASRAFINLSTCAQINALTNSNLRDLLDNMLEGFTGDEDEQAILRVLSCLDCTRRSQLVSMVGRSRLLDELHGQEDDQLRALFAQCGI